MTEYTTLVRLESHFCVHVSQTKDTLLYGISSQAASLPSFHLLQSATPRLPLRLGDASAATASSHGIGKHESLDDDLAAEERRIEAEELRIVEEARALAIAKEEVQNRRRLAALLKLLSVQQSTFDDAKANAMNARSAVKQCLDTVDASRSALVIAETALRNAQEELLRSELVQRSAEENLQVTQQLLQSSDAVLSNHPSSV